jgi:acyl CoA:acetate/3-ketoacid CoA transferase beta subunit
LLTQMAPGVTIEELTEKTGAGFAVADSLKG